MLRMAVFVICALLLAHPAVARDTLQFVTVTGTVASGSDGTGEWGGGNLAGDQFTLLFTLDLSQGHPFYASHEFDVPPRTIDVSWESGASGPASVDLTIGGISKTVSGSASYVLVGDAYDYSESEGIGETFSSSDGSFETSVNILPFHSALTLPKVAMY
jgi:hypothetical protein